jgi:hypothetical protein
MRFCLEISTDNDAFHDDEGATYNPPEVCRILRDVADRLERGEDFTSMRKLRDYNGNTVGNARFFEQ